MYNPFSLTGKTILITGASSGIGQAIAKSCSDQGARLLLLGRDIDRLKETELLCENGEEHKFLSVDLSENQNWNLILNNLLTEIGKLEINGFVHAAGVSPTIPFKVLKQKQVLDTFQLNIFSAIPIIQEITKSGIRPSGGSSIILISSVMSEVGEKGKSVYAMTKSAIIGMVKSLALEYADKKIRFNAISPSVVNTPLSEKSYYRINELAMNQMILNHPLGLGEPSDIGNAAVFLLSNASSWITGTNLIVDGGYLAK